MKLPGLVLLLLLFPGDALAWGLQTHLFFAHYALLGIAFADPELRAAAARLPGLVLAGACLPDLALAGAVLGTPAFRRAHRWSMLRKLCAAPRCDEERALGIGYATHLVADVEAHNAFVPEYEGRFGRVPHVVHALAEWAMDRHLQRRSPARPREVLAAHHGAARAFVTSRFGCSTQVAERALRFLERADGALRSSPVPAACSAVVRVFDRRVASRFDDYVRRTGERMAGLEAALGGGCVDWVSSDPEGHACEEGTDRAAGQHVARVMQAKHHA